MNESAIDWQFTYAVNNLIWGDSLCILSNGNLVGGYNPLGSNRLIIHDKETGSIASYLSLTLSNLYTSSCY